MLYRYTSSVDRDMLLLLLEWWSLRSSNEILRFSSARPFTDNQRYKEKIRKKKKRYGINQRAGITTTVGRRI